MSFNSELSAIFEQMASLLELTGANKFRVNAHARAARVVGDHHADLEPIAHDEGELTKLDGIGKGTAEKIAEFAETGKIAEHEELLEQVPHGLLAVLEVPGLGPKTVKLLWDEMGVTDIASLKAALDSEKITELPRMGTKSVEKIRASLAYAESAGQRLLLGMAQPVAEQLVERMSAVKGVTRCAFAGSMRRGKETIGDIDILVTASDPAKAHAAFRGLPGVVQVIASGESKTSVRLELPAEFGRWRGLDDGSTPTVQADLRVVPEASWGAALMYFTGSKEHNVRLREHALKKGLTLNEYGLFKEDGESEPPQKRGIKPVAGKTEEEVYAKLGLPWMPPEIREDRGELALKGTPRLIEVADINAELHAHTTASDGTLSLDELVSCARDRGFHTITVTDHSKSSVQANGLSVERLHKQREAIEAARERFGDSITILHGNEVDILADGSLDYDDDVLGWLDVVVASPHVALSQDPKKATARLLRAIEHPMVHVIGHPTGRLISRRPGLEPAMDELIAAAVEHDVALEINTHWLRLDLRDTHVRAAVEAGCKIAIDCDVHAAEDFENIRFGVTTGRRGWLPPELVVNTWPAAKLHEWIRSKRQ
ncbi:MAG: DNA polymerase/3'-5' exonuclease PolX [Phycisphaeraceae bacterium]|nr:MAG: DNA polymerase/3'-5' exonuclease PolX [Phycisphaeraceae bacterium]